MKEQTEEATKLSNVIREPTKTCTWNENTEVISGFGFERTRARMWDSPYLSSMGISEKWSSSASLIGL